MRVSNETHNTSGVFEQMFLQIPMMTVATTLLNHLQTLYLFLTPTLKWSLCYRDTTAESNNPVVIDDSEPTLPINIDNQLEQPGTSRRQQQRHSRKRKMASPRQTSTKLNKKSPATGKSNVNPYLMMTLIPIT